MPELPEVETIRRGLEKNLIGESVSVVEVRDRRLMSLREARRWQGHVPGHEWSRLERRGKYLIVVLDNAWRLMFHLRMTGQLVLSDKPSDVLFRLRLTFESGRVLDFYDQRRFGEAWLLSPTDPWPSKTPLGPDALTELTRDQFVGIIKGRTTRIHPLLLDQQRLAGVGNIYAQEALFKASIRPSRSAGRLTRSEAERLFGTLRETLETAITHRGSSKRNYLDAEGLSGGAQLLHLVYQKDGTPCPRCGSVLRASRIGGRGAVYCAKCQK